MTNPTPHGQVPEALRLAEQYDYGDPEAHGNAWKAAVCTELRRLAELEAQIEALIGGQALSAAPPALLPYPPLPMQFACSGVFAVYSADQMRAYVDADRAARAPADSVAAPAIGDELRDTLVAVSAAIAEREDRAAQKMIGEILAASPTPPAEQQATSAAAADTVLEAALRAIHQAIDLIGEPDTERLRTVRRVLRGAVIVAEDAGEAATAPQPAPAPLSEPIDQLERALAIIGVVGAIDGHDVVRRESVLEIARRAALAAHGGNKL